MTARLIGNSSAMREVRARIEQIAAFPVPVLILGETGTGKELCAGAIADLSGSSPFIPVNCAAFQESLADSELFGHKRGAFTGADRDRTGLIAAAHGGTLFLDELGELPSAVQAKLLRTLESGEYRPVGSTGVLRSTFRILAATHRDLNHLVEAGRLRTDLLYRLGAARIMLPPLRERVEDISLLAEDFLRQSHQRSGGPTRLSADACDLLCDYDWPGNIRELRNVVEAAAVWAGSGEELSVQHVLRTLPRLDPGDAPADRAATLAEGMRRAEKRMLCEALRRAGGKRRVAAELLAISEATLYRMLGRHFEAAVDPAGAATWGTGPARALDPGEPVRRRPELPARGGGAIEGRDGGAQPVVVQPDVRAPTPTPWRVAVASALVVSALVFVPRSPEPVSAVPLGGRLAWRDSAWAYRSRAEATGAIKAGLPAALVAEKMVQTADARAVAGDKARAAQLWRGAVTQYREAAREAARERDAVATLIERVTPVVKALGLRAETA